MTTSDSAPAMRPKARGRGVSLANLILLVTACGAFAANLMPVMETARKTNNFSGMIPLSVFGAVLGMVAGVPVGLCQRRPGLGVLLGVLTGMTIGAMAGPMAILPAERFGELVRISLGGGVVLVVFAIVARRLGQ